MVHLPVGPTRFVQQKEIFAHAILDMRVIHSRGVLISMNAATMFVDKMVIVSIHQDRMNVNVTVDIEIRHQMVGVLILMNVLSHLLVVPTLYVPITQDPFSVLVRLVILVLHQVSSVLILMSVLQGRHAVQMPHHVTTLLDHTLAHVNQVIKIHHLVEDVSILTNVRKVVIIAILSTKFAATLMDHSLALVSQGIKVSQVLVRMSMNVGRGISVDQMRPAPIPLVLLAVLAMQDF